MNWDTKNLPYYNKEKNYEWKWSQSWIFWASWKVVSGKEVSKNKSYIPPKWAVVESHIVSRVNCEEIEESWSHRRVQEPYLLSHLNAPNWTSNQYENSINSQAQSSWHGKEHQGHTLIYFASGQWSPPNLACCWSTIIYSVPCINILRCRDSIYYTPTTDNNVMRSMGLPLINYSYSYGWHVICYQVWIFNFCGPYGVHNNVCQPRQMCRMLQH